MTVADAKKSTIVRTPSRPLRLTFRALELVAPAIGARWAEHLWFRLPPTRPIADPVPGGEPFEVHSQGGVIRGRRWGSGPVVYLVHGWGGHSGQFANLIPPLVASGFTVVTHDAPSHGRSDPGPTGPSTSNAAEFGRAIDAVAAEHGPAYAVIAHSMGGIATMLALRDGWLGTQRLVLVAPMANIEAPLRMFERALGFGSRTRHRLIARANRRVGLPAHTLSMRSLGQQIDQPDLLVVHDEGDPETPYAASSALVQEWPGARLFTTTGLGHRRVLRDKDVVTEIVFGLSSDLHVESQPVTGAQSAA